MLPPFRFEDLPKDIHFIWHGVNDHKNLESFLKSGVYWAEGDLRGLEDSLVLRHDPLDTHDLQPGESLLDFRHWLETISASGKGIQIDFKEGNETMQRTIALLKDLRISQSRLWFTTNLKDVAMEEYAKLGQAFPEAALQSTIPIRFMYQEMGEEERLTWLDLNRGLGVRHLSISWYDEPKPEEIQEIREAGFSINLFYVNTIEDIRRAITLKPDSITSDFHIPEWGLFGRGSGENGFYPLEKA